MAQIIRLEDQDEAFFSDHPDREIRIREPAPKEFAKEFRTFGLHSDKRRRVIIHRLPAWKAQIYNLKFMKIPFLLFADETVEDRDDVLLPMLDEIMRTALREGE